jgi:uncharacterized protein (DUF934 family)
VKFIDSHDPHWHAADGQDGPQPAPTPADHLLLTLEQWHAVREHWPSRFAVGVRLPNEAEVEQLVPDLPRLAMIALQFPKWVDGRAYSQATLLRRRWRFRGEIRAMGEVLVDMLPLLQRTGFDAVQLRVDQDARTAKRTLGFFEQGHYQGDVNETQPWFARRAAWA